MKKYITPSSRVLTLEPAEMLATSSISIDSTKTADSSEGGWSEGRGWNAANWSGADDED